MDHSPRHIVAVMGLVSDTQGRVLLVKTERRGWEPPGGQVELGEDLVTALKREVIEESGCDVEVQQLIGVYSNVGGLGIVMFLFLCTHLRGVPCGGDECLEASWFTPEDALRVVTHPAQGPKLRHALEARDADGSAGIVYHVYRTVPDPRAAEGYRTYYEMLSERRY